MIGLQQHAEERLHETRLVLQQYPCWQPSCSSFSSEMLKMLTHTQVSIWHERDCTGAISVPKTFTGQLISAQVSDMDKAKQTLANCKQMLGR